MSVHSVPCWYCFCDHDVPISDLNCSSTYLPIFLLYSLACAAHPRRDSNKSQLTIRLTAAGRCSLAPLIWAHPHHDIRPDYLPILEFCHFLILKEWR